MQFLYALSQRQPALKIKKNSQEIANRYYFIVIVYFSLIVTSWLNFAKSLVPSLTTGFKYRRSRLSPSENFWLHFMLYYFEEVNRLIRELSTACDLSPVILKQWDDYARKGDEPNKVSLVNTQRKPNV
uniref:Uncharacterized protein n=1 Tax=Glossina austeni TaxID=7395 RepID=A0A1A9VT90_GLOAU